MFIALLAIVAGMIYLNYKMPAIKGKLGEKSVAATLSFLPADEYTVLNDMMFKIGNRTTQIDHIVISTHGIFVIETKNYKGWIYGSSYRDYWTQNIWGNKYSLYNPIFQNQNHIKFLISKFSILHEYRDYIFPVIVFLRASRLNISGDSNCVLWRSQLNRYIKSCPYNVMTRTDCDNIASILSDENISDKNERTTHKQNVNQAIITYHNKVNSGICPRCGGQLVLRSGKCGEFWGCSNFPRCRYTHS